MGAKQQPEYDFVAPSVRPRDGSTTGQVVPHPYLQPRRSGLPRWALALIVTPVVLVGLGVAAVVTAPLLIGRQATAQWHNTTVVLPSVVNGQDRSPDSPMASDAQLSALGLPPGSLAVYGSGLDTTLLIATRTDMALSEAAQSTLRGTLAAGYTKSSGRTLHLNQLDAGPLGGYLGCTAASEAGTVCVATDAGSLVMLMTPTRVPDSGALMRQVRAETVHRR